MIERVLHRPVPRLLSSLRGYNRESFLADLFSGVTLGFVALPLAMALGIASLTAASGAPYSPPAIGIFSAVLAGFIISAFGGSRVQIGGPTATFIPIILLILERHGFQGLILATMMAGCIQMLMGLFRMGNLIKFIPYPVTCGLTTGIAVAIMVTQGADLLGIDAAGAPPREFHDKLGWVWQHASSITPATLVTSVLCLVLMAIWARRGWKLVPAPLLAVVVATLVVHFLGLDRSLGIATVGSKFPEGVPTGLPPLLFPDLSLGMIRELIGPATALALLGAIESLLSAVVADGLAGEHHDSNTELFAQGLANFVCPFFCGLPASGAIARTTANINNGGRTPIAGIVCAATLLLIVLVLAPLAQHVPMAAMAAVVVRVAFRMGEWHELVRLRRMPGSDALVLATTLGLTVVFDLVVAVEVGMVLAAVLFIRRISETTEVTRVTGEDELETPEQLMHGRKIPEGVLVYRIFGPFLFGAAEKMEQAFASMQGTPRVLILRMQLVPAMDATALNALESLLERMRHFGGTVILSGPHRQPLEVMRKGGFIEKIGRENVRANFDQALARAEAVLSTPRT